MTSEIEAIKTNEILRRRKLRLQQVREQSKDIAKTIRQRAEVEKLRNSVELNDKKAKEYFLQQDKLVNKLEQLYTKSLQNVGAGHKNASDVKHKESNPEKADIALLRGKEAIAELRRKKQQLFDEKRRLLERKSQAREVANEISREKSVNVANKLMLKSSSKCTEDTDVNRPFIDISADKVSDNRQIDQNQFPSDIDKNQTDAVERNDMATQWEIGVIPDEWEPNVPSLLIPQDGSLKDSANNNTTEKSEKTKKPNLFAISSEMPSSLRGGLINLTDESGLPKPSLTLVSEYLQNRGLKLRETDTTGLSKRHTDDLQSIKQTIQRTRTSKTEVSGKSKPVDRSDKAGDTNNALNKKKSIMTYNHATKDSRYVACGEEKLVIRDSQDDIDDAYSKAMKETSIKNTKEKEYQKIMQDMRSKIAMTKQNVEKEYKDTMMFLNSLPNSRKTSNPTKNTFMDVKQQGQQRSKRQQKIQQEFKKIQKDCRNHNMSMRSGNMSTIKGRSKSKSPTNQDFDDDFAVNDFQYSWMPVPETDGNLAIHTIPTTLKEARQGNTVKFSKVDSYHEYRSRHKHTPPTKDTNDIHEKAPKKHVETVLIQNDSNESSDYSSVASDTSSVENLQLSNNKQNEVPDKDVSDADRIIIYKILDTKSKKDKAKRKAKCKKMTKPLNSAEFRKKDYLMPENKNSGCNKKDTNNVEQSLDQLKEGAYKVSEKGDNITSMYFSEHRQEDEKIALSVDEIKYGRPCCCGKKVNSHQEKATTNQSKCCDSSSKIGVPGICLGCKCGCTDSKNNRSKQKGSQNLMQSSASTSISSFKTASNDKPRNASPGGDFIKLIEEGGEEEGKFYIGATGFLKKDAYEVVIQLRKKEAKEDDKKQEKESVELTSTVDKKKGDQALTSDEKLLLENSSLTEKIGPTARELSKESEITSNTKISTLSYNQKQSTDAEIRDYLSSRTLSDTESRKIALQKTSEAKTTNIAKDNYSAQNSKEQVVSSWEPDQASVIKSMQNVVDKGVHTPIQLSYAIPDNVTKADPVSKPGTSVYTQTSIISPRPALIHMSSSTSTAYMSPPELVMPKYLRKDMICKEIHNAEIKVMDQHEYCEEYVGCTCRGCTHARKITCYAKTRHCNKKLDTPSNTARSGESSIHINKNRYTLTSLNQIPKKTKCHKCENRSRIKLYNSQKSNRNLTKTKSHNGRRASSGTASHKNKVANICAERKISKSSLNPIIKEYVNKLLALNKESLKAIEVVNQECSSVTTPGSSIIDLPCNIAKDKCNVQSKISLEHLKQLLKQQILDNYEQSKQKNDRSTKEEKKPNSCIDNNIRFKSKLSRKRSVHKVKSLNISKQLLKVKSSMMQQSTKKVKPNMQSSTTSSFKDDSSDKKPVTSSPNKIKPRSKSSPTPRLSNDYNLRHKNTGSDIGNKKLRKLKLEKKHIPIVNFEVKSRAQHLISLPSHRSTLTSTSPGTDSNNHNISEEPINISTQTINKVDTEVNFIKLAENKLQNMEKIADLTEKCTKRLSNLAKVLEEVRRNKSLAYSQFSTSDSTSDSDQRSERNRTTVSHNIPVPEVQNEPPITEIENNMITSQFYNQIVETQSSKSSSQSIVETQENNVYSYLPKQENRSKKESFPLETKETNVLNPLQYTPLLSDLPKPAISKLSADKTHNISTDSVSALNDTNAKIRRRPPTALSRTNFKLGQEFIVPHELSTVIEVDSPMSLKHKARSTSDSKSVQSTNDSIKVLNNSNEVIKDENSSNIVRKECIDNPDLLQNNILQRNVKDTATDSSDDYKIQMIDMKRFNEIMLKPFISVQDYAKQYNAGTLDEGSNLEDVPKDYNINDDISSLQSDGSLPDVIAELLKRNLINEPFKFDTASNVNSTTYSSESSLSVLALSKVRKEKRKPSVTFQNKENIAETSDTLSLSSNPDLENAFKNLGMGWASSTLKKTKERLALSSSSNSSNSSTSHKIKLKSFIKQDAPILVTDSVSSTLNLPKKVKGIMATDTAKNVEQQTSITNSMTVKEFLTNELAKKITFTNKSNINDTEDVFVSLYETKMPEEMKHSSNMITEKSVDSIHSGDNNRARTSTPVQIFKSTAYHSSSSSNVSNGLFSNADDLSSVKGTSNSIRNHSTSEKDDLTIPNLSLKTKKENSECSKSD